MTRVVSHKSSTQDWLRELQTFGEELRANPGAIQSWEGQKRAELFYGEELPGIVASMPRQSAPIEPPGLDTLQDLLARQKVRGESGLRERLLRFLIYLRLHPWLAWLSRVIPYRFQRGLKRMLSRRPVHENQ